MSWVRITYYGLLGICLAVLLLNSKKLNKVYYWFVPLIISAIGVQVSREVLKQIHFTGYDFVFHIYQPVEYSLLALFYYTIVHARRTRKAILVSIPVVVLFSVLYYTIGGGDFFGGDFLDFFVCSFFLCIWTIVFFMELLRTDENIDLVTYPAFWVNAANLLFYGGCLMIMGINFYLSKSDPELAERLLDINRYLNLVLYSMYIIGFIQPLKWKK